MECKKKDIKINGKKTDLVRSLSVYTDETTRKTELQLIISGNLDENSIVSLPDTLRDVVYDGVRFQYGQKSSTYDRANYLDADGKITASYSDKGFPIIGGTVMKMAETDGAFTQSYIYYCRTE